MVRRRMALDCQTFAALCAARCNNGAAATGFHTRQKTVGTGAFDFGRLIGTFHGGSGCLLGVIPDEDQDNR